MKEWWSGLTGRERGMIYIAGGLSLLIGMYALVYLPLVQSKARAEREFQRMSLEAQQVFEGLALLQRIDLPERPMTATSAESLELLLSRTAAANGLQIVRLQPSGTQQLTVWFDQANPQVLMSWLTNLEMEQGVRVSRTELRKRDDQPSLRGSVQLGREAGQ